MLLNPFLDKLETINGSRILNMHLGLIGHEIQDLHKDNRTWIIQTEYAPIPGRALGGIRVKLVDNKGFISFLNQRDLEVLLEIAEPGEPCYWTGGDYPAPGSREWFGLCADEEDLEDDLFEQELLLRADYPTLPTNLELTRRVHLGRGKDVEDLSILLYDMDPETGLSPDTRFSTLHRRWSRVEQRKVIWELH